MLRPSPNHGTQRLPNDDDDDGLVDSFKVNGSFKLKFTQPRACLYYLM